MSDKNSQSGNVDYQKLLKYWRDSVKANIAYRKEQVRSNLLAIKHLQKENEGMRGMIQCEERMLKEKKR